MVKQPRSTQLSISLPQEMAQAVYQQVKNGTYTSAGDLIREAVRQLLERDGAPDDTPPAPADPNQRQPRTGTRQRSH